MKVYLELIKCRNCGRIGVAINHYRITRHKCAGLWKTIHSEEVDAAEVRGTVTAKMCRAAAKCREDE